MLITKLYQALLVTTIGVIVFYALSNFSPPHKWIVLKSLKSECEGRSCTNGTVPLGNVTEVVTVGNRLTSNDERKELDFTSTTSQRVSQRVSKRLEQDVGRKTRFLFTVVQKHDGFGNNVQYRLFTFTVGQALLHNRTVVAIPFFDNGSSGWGYSLESMRPFDKTFDIDLLKTLVPVATLDQFRKQCSNSVQIARQEVRVLANLNDSISFYENIYNVRFLSNSLSSDPISLLSSKVRCLAIFYTRTDPANQLAVSLTDVVYSTVTKYLRPTVPLDRTVNNIIPQICSGEPYLAIHYRNTTGEVCMFKESIFDRCQELLDKNEKRTELLIGGIYRIRKSHQFRCIYVAHPEWSQRFTYLLSRRLPDVHIVNALDILKMDIDGMDEYKNDNYYLSLLEQEICIRSEVFLGWAFSFWDKTVMVHRQIQERESLTFADVLGIDEICWERAWKENVNHQCEL